MNNISKTAEIDATSTILNSKIGENCLIGKMVKLCYSSVGDFSYIYDNSHVFSSKIGKYCSISWNVSIGPGEHDYNRLTTHPLLYAQRFGFLEEYKPFYNQYSNDINIGNDVWIGCNVLIKRGVTIGDGAVVGANAIITKSIEPYSIVIDNNKFLKKRFTDKVINELLELQWWNYPPQLIKKYTNLLANIGTYANVLELKEKLASQNE